MTAHIVVEGVAKPQARPVVRLRLGHGTDPALALARAGWQVVHPLEARTRSFPRWQVTIRFLVTQSQVGSPGDADAAPPADAGLSDADIAAAVPHQRVAAYAIVRSARGLLLTQLSERTNAAGRWNLPGGGVDKGEGLTAAIHREIREETDQVVEDVRLVAVDSRRWIGRAPSGRVEDYHAIRLYHTASCPQPTEPVVNDVGGSTSQGRWVQPADLSRMPLVDSILDLVHRFGPSS